MPRVPPNNKIVQNVVNNHGMKPVIRIIPSANAYKSKVLGTLPCDHFSTGSRKLIANLGVEIQEMSNVSIKPAVIIGVM